MNNIEELHYENRCLRTLTGALLFGPNGARLCVDVLKRGFGFTGTIDFIHKMNITQLFAIECDAIKSYAEAKVMWYPTYMQMNYEKEGLICREKKTVTSEDAAVSVIKVENNSEKVITFRLQCQPDGFRVKTGTGRLENGLSCYAESPELRFGIRAGIVLVWNHENKEISVKPGEKRTVIAAALVGNMAAETEEQLWNKLEQLWARHEREDFMREMIQDNEAFYSEAPSFVCDDDRMNKCWKYRWYILKNTMCRPGYGRFHETVMYEGRDHRMQKTALKPQGWEFSRLIPLSTPLQLNDLRWHPDKKTRQEIIRSAFQGQDENGLLLCSDVETAAKSYANYMIWAVWLVYLIDRDKQFAAQLLPKMKKYIEGHERSYQDNNDSLLIERKHSLTGKEYQPSYWYFHQYPADPKDPNTYTPLKRVDRSIYHYLNLKGLANLMRELGDEDYKKYEQKAAALKQDINQKMWDPETGYYYDLHYQTEEKAYVKNIVGIYPYWADCAEEKCTQGIEKLLDKNCFDLGNAFPSVSKDCPAFSPDGGWQGYFLKGRNGCVWCGPSWPYTTGIALEALGNQSRKQNHRYDENFDRFLTEYTIQHFRDGDANRPYLVEHYNPISGERLSDEADYNHSFWIDIIVSYVAGVIVKADRIIIDPLRTHLDWFELSNLKIRGHLLTVSYNKNRKEKPLKVYVDGQEKDLSICNEIRL